MLANYSLNQLENVIRVDIIWDRYLQVLKIEPEKEEEVDAVLW